MANSEENIYNVDFRKKLIANPRAVVEELQIGQVADDVEFVVVKNTKDTVYVVLDKPGDELDLSNIQAAGVTSSVSTGGTIGTATLTVSSAGSVATIGSAL